MKSLSKARQGFSLLRRAVHLAWTASPGWTLISLGLICLQSVMPLAVLYATKMTLDAVTAALRTPNQDHNGSVVRWVVFTGVAGWLFQATRTLTSHASEVQGEIVSEYVQKIIADKASQLDLAYYENPAYFDTLHQTQHEAPYRPARVVSALVQVAQCVLSLLALSSLVLVAFRWSVALTVVAIALLGLLARLRNVRLLFRWRLSKTGQERQLGYYHLLLNSASIAKEIRLFGLGPLFAQRAAALRETLRRGRMRLSAQRIAGELATQAFASAGIIVAFLSLVRNTLQHTLTLGGLVMELQALQRAAGLIQDLIVNTSQLYEHGLFMNRFYEFMALQPAVSDPPVGVPLAGVARQAIRFENVGFRYPTAARPVLEGINLVIGPGEMVAFVGENGAGKSTLIKLLCRLYDPTAGRIFLGDTDLRALRRADLWANFSVLFQDFVPYQNTVAENIWFGACEREHTEGAIEAAAEHGGAASFVRALPRGYEQMLGLINEGGTEISGGQWQKIALSRTFYRDAPIVILDEPSSALDVQSEHEVFERFKELTAGKTSVVISHRLSTVRMADRIFYLDRGQVAEVGSHDELMARGGAYADLFKTQAANYR